MGLVQGRLQRDLMSELNPESPSDEIISQVDNSEGGWTSFVKKKMFLLNIWGVAPRR